MNKEVVRNIALSNGFQIALDQPDLPQKVYVFASEIVSNYLNRQIVRLNARLAELKKEHEGVDCNELKLYLKGCIQAYEEELDASYHELTQMRDITSRL